MMQIPHPKELKTEAMERAATSDKLSRNCIKIYIKGQKNTIYTLEGKNKLLC